MYNRYVPQPDGSHKRRRMSEPSRPPKPQPPPAAPQDSEPICSEPPLQQPTPCPAEQPIRHEHRQMHIKQNGIPDFFRQLLPRDLDTADLMILILLLLIAGDREDQRNNALLTLALYFFM